MKVFRVFVDGVPKKDFPDSLAALAYANALKDKRGEDLEDDSVRVSLVSL